MLADDGNSYSTVQAAQDAASSWIRLPPATFNENVTIDTAGLSVVGSGDSSFVNGGSGVAFEVSVSNVIFDNLKIATDTSSGSYAIYAPNSSADHATVSNVKIDGTGDRAIYLYDGSNYRVGWNIINTRIFDAGGNSAISQANQGVVAGCHIDGADNQAIPCWHDAIVAGNVITNPAGTGISLGQNGYDGVVYGNRIHNAGDHGISLAGADNIVVNNRVSNSTNADISTGGSGNIVRDNDTGASN